MATQIIDLNEASAQELIDAGIEGMDEKRANALIAYREEYGPFATWEDVMDVPGFSRTFINVLQDAGVTLGAARAAADEQQDLPAE